MGIDTIAREYERVYITTIAPQLPSGNVVYEAGGRAVRNLWRMERYDAGRTAQAGCTAAV